ncbi:MAG: oligopeptide/dipeptide ABC transporter ATP-binding protein, partial [Actinomycetota bacterium]
QQWAAERGLVDGNSASLLRTADGRRWVARTAGAHQVVLEGRLPDPTDRPLGCSFAARCMYVQPKCLAEHPPLTDDGDGHLYRCWFPLGTK